MLLTDIYVIGSPEKSNIFHSKRYFLVTIDGRAMRSSALESESFALQRGGRKILNFDFSPP